MKKTIRNRKQSPKVVVTMGIPWAYERELLQGVSQYSHHQGPWAMYIRVLTDKRMASHLDSANASGLIVLNSNFPKNKSFLESGIPAIVFTDKDEDWGNIPTIRGDEEATGRLGAEHLLERRFKNFAFCGYSGVYWSERRYQGFAERIKQAGLTVSLCNINPPTPLKSLENERQEISQWIKSLPKPLGLMACDDINSINVVEACRMEQIHIPDDVAILGVDNDNLLCNLSYPPISSVVMANQAAGYEAAQLLDRLMKGQEAMSGQKIIIQPSHVATRMSTDILSVEDPLVLEALKLIRQNSDEPLQTSEIAEMLAVSRQLLHNRFCKTIGCSVHDEIKNVRIERIVTLLLETDLTIENIALNVGYSSANHLARYFKQAKGVTPWEYRKKYQKTAEIK